MRRLYGYQRYFVKYPGAKIRYRTWFYRFAVGPNPKVTRSQRISFDDIRYLMTLIPGKRILLSGIYNGLLLPLIYISSQWHCTRMPCRCPPKAPYGYEHSQNMFEASWELKRVPVRAVHLTVSSRVDYIVAINTSPSAEALCQSNRRADAGYTEALEIDETKVGGRRGLRSQVLNLLWHLD